MQTNSTCFMLMGPYNDKTAQVSFHGGTSLYIAIMIMLAETFGNRPTKPTQVLLDDH